MKFRHPPGMGINTFLPVSLGINGPIAGIASDIDLIRITSIQSQRHGDKDRRYYRRNRRLGNSEYTR